MMDSSCPLNTIHNEDCLITMAQIPDASIDLICTDPPYRLRTRGDAGTSGGMLTSDGYLSGYVFEYNEILPHQYAPEFFRILKDGTHCYVMTNHYNLQSFLNEFTAAGFRFSKSLIWDKVTKINGSKYMSQFEYILFFSKGKDRPINNPGTADILTVPNIKNKDVKGNNLHNTEKPVNLMKILIGNSSNENDIVMDPFMGIGTTAVAAIHMNRQFIGSEIDPAYHKIAMERVAGAKARGRLF